jgi:hypothetical protein
MVLNSFFMTSLLSLYKNGRSTVGRPVGSTLAIHCFGGKFLEQIIGAATFVILAST